VFAMDDNTVTAILIVCALLGYAVYRVTGGNEPYEDGYGDEDDAWEDADE
jgi:hypothetical protein